MSLPIWEGYPHTTSVLRSNGIERILDYDPVLQSIPDMTYATEFITRDCEGVYFKWLNRFGGYQYWLFSNVYTAKVKTKNKGIFNSAFTNRVTSFSRVHTLGKTSKTTLEVYDRIPWQYMNIVKGITESPEVYLYTDKLPRALSVERCGWIKVNLKDGSFDLWSTKNSTEELRLKVELPEDYMPSIL